MNIFQTANAAIEELENRNLYRTLNLVQEQRNALQDMLLEAEEQKTVLEEIHDKAEKTYHAFKHLPLTEKIKFAFADMLRI
jgi:hypothetical protein